VIKVENYVTETVFFVCICGCLTNSQHAC